MADETQRQGGGSPAPGTDLAAASRNEAGAQTAEPAGNAQSQEAAAAPGTALAVISQPASAEVSGYHPLLTVWLWPQATIAHILRRPRLLPILALAASGGAYSVLANASDALAGGGIAFHEALILALLLGPAIGIGFTYFLAAFLAWIGRFLGGRATRREMLSVLAWSGAPALAGLAAIGAAVGAGGSEILHQMAFSPPRETAGGIALIGALAILGVWSYFLALRMIGAAQGFGFWRSLLNYAAILLLFLPLLAFRTLVFQPFSIPAASMAPALIPGDFIFVNKFRYGYGKYSFPVALSFSGRSPGFQPRRGDIVVFRLPSDPATDYVKRIAGLPGDEINVKNGLLVINGLPVKTERLPDYPTSAASGFKVRAARHREILPDGVAYEVLDAVRNGPADDTKIFKVPPGHYFMLGDNRDNSQDSRFWRVGFVPRENLVGRVSLIFYSAGRDEGAGAGAIRWERVFRRM